MFFHRLWIQHIAANIKTYRIGLIPVGDVAVSGEVIFKVALEKDGIDLPSGSQPEAVLPTTHLTMFGNILVVTTRERGTTDT